MQYVLCHKDFNFPTNTWLGQELVAIWQRHSPDQESPKTNLPLMEYTSKYDDRIYGELGAWDWISNNSKDEFNGLHHYRRLIQYPTYQIAVPKPIAFGGSLADQMSYYHSPKVTQTLDKVLASDILHKLNVFFPYNLYNAPKEVLINWLQFVIPHVEKAVFELGYAGLTYEQFVDKVANDKSFVTGGPEKNVSSTYQARWPACAIERLNSIFWQLVCQYPYIPCEINLLEAGQKI